MKHKGFTVIELVIVIVVIAILFTIGLVSYSYMRDDGMDTKIRGVVKTVGDAIQLYETEYNSLPVGGGYFNKSNGVDGLVPQFLQANYRDGIHKTKHANYAHHVFRWYPCLPDRKQFAVYASLNNPTQDDLRQFNEVRTKCRHNTDIYTPTTGSPSYNYAQLF